MSGPAPDLRSASELLPPDKYAMFLDAVRVLVAAEAQRDAYKREPLFDRWNPVLFNLPGRCATTSVITTSHNNGKDQRRTIYKWSTGPDELSYETISADSPMHEHDKIGDRIYADITKEQDIINGLMKRVDSARSEIYGVFAHGPCRLKTAKRDDGSNYCKFDSPCWECRTLKPFVVHTPFVDAPIVIVDSQGWREPYHNESSWTSQQIIIPSTNRFVDLSGKADGNLYAAPQATDKRWTDGTICAYCFDEQPDRSCSCNVWVHNDCWTEHNGCPTLGCQYSPIRDIDPEKLAAKEAGVGDTSEVGASIGKPRRGLLARMLGR